MMTMTTELLTRDGSVFTGKVQHDDKGKPGYEVQDRCSRCGGAGGSDKWRATGWTCFDCGGSGKGKIRWNRLYTAEQLAKTNAAQEKREAKKQEKIAAKQAEIAAARNANTEKFNAEHADLLVALGALIEEKPIVADIVRKGRERGIISDAQKSVLVNAVASAQKFTAAQAASNHVGAIGDKVKATVTVTHVASYERTPFRGGYIGVGGRATETVWIVSMTDENGNVFVTKTPSFNEPKGDTFILTGTVKEHSDYKGIKQTVLQRAKRTEIPTGQAAGFKKIAE